MRTDQPKMMPVSVLLSGGIDSAAALYYYRSRGNRVDAVHVDYGQIAATREAAAATAVAGFYSVPLTTIVCRGFGPWGSGEVPLRNSLLGCLGLMRFGDTGGAVALGIHTGTGYPDCSADWLGQMQALADLHFGGRVCIAAPFVDWRKAEVWAYCRGNGVPLELTYSCELGQDQPCGRCSSCRDIAELGAR